MGMTMSNRGSKGTGEESPGREVGVGEFDLDMLRLTSLGGGEPRSAQYTGTKALMLAILEDGIRSILSPVGRIRNEAEYWIKSGRPAFAILLHGGVRDARAGAGGGARRARAPAGSQRLGAPSDRS